MPGKTDSGFDEWLNEINAGFNAWAAEIEKGFDSILEEWAGDLYKTGREEADNQAEKNGE